MPGLRPYRAVQDAVRSRKRAGLDEWLRSRLKGDLIDECRTITADDWSQESDQIAVQQ